MNLETQCIEFRGAKSTNGYGHIGIEGKIYRAHRISYILFKGPIPSNLCVDHICRNRACINPDHLRLLTLKENVLCGEELTAQYKKRTRCKNGHPLVENNLYKSPSSKNRRDCIKCRRTQCLKYYHKTNYPRRERP